eukprot:scaffold1056_cov564-Prasinococcus_capsulatus_cf.AAC.16
MRTHEPGEKTARDCCTLRPPTAQAAHPVPTQVRPWRTIARDYGRRGLPTFAARALRLCTPVGGFDALAVGANPGPSAGPCPRDSPLDQGSASRPYPAAAACHGDSARGGPRRAHATPQRRDAAAHALASSSVRQAYPYARCCVARRRPQGRPRRRRQGEGIFTN